MATVPEAIAILAEHAAEPGLRVDQYARYLQNARILPVAPAPRAALPGLDAGHLSALLIGCLASPTAIDAPDAVRQFGALVAGRPYDIANDAGEPTGARRQSMRRPSLKGGHNADFLSSLADLVRALAAGNAAGPAAIVAVGAGTRAGVPFAFIDLRRQPRTGNRSGQIERLPFGPHQGGGLQRVSRLPGTAVTAMAALLAAAGTDTGGNA